MLIIEFNLDIIEYIININNNVIECKLKKNSIYKLYHTNEYFRKMLKNQYNRFKKEIYYFRNYKKRINNYYNQLIKLENKILCCYIYPNHIINDICKASNNIKRYIIKRKKFLKLYNMIYCFEGKLVKIYNDLNFLWNENFKDIDRNKIEYNIGCIRSIN